MTKIFTKKFLLSSIENHAFDFHLLQKVHSKQANRALKRKKLLLFTDRSLQASQQDAKTQGVTAFSQTHDSKQANRVLKRKELLQRGKKRATPQLLGQDTKHHFMNDFTHHTAKAAVVLLGGRSLQQTDIIKAPH